MDSDSGVDLLTMSSFSSEHCVLRIVQQPIRARVAVGKEKGALILGTAAPEVLIMRPDRKPVDPPPIIKLSINNKIDPRQDYLQSMLKLARNR